MISVSGGIRVNVFWFCVPPSCRFALSCFPTTAANAFGAIFGRPVFPDTMMLRATGLHANDLFTLDIAAHRLLAGTFPACASSRAMGLGPATFATQTEALRFERSLPTDGCSSRALPATRRRDLLRPASRSFLARHNRRWPLGSTAGQEHLRQALRACGRGTFCCVFCHEFCAASFRALAFRFLAAHALRVPSTSASSRRTARSSFAGLFVQLRPE